VTFGACRVQASRTAGDPNEPPTVSQITFEPAQPVVGQPFTARVTVSERDGWSVSGANWSGGPCGAERPSGGSTELSRSFTAEQTGPFCVSVIVSLRGPTTSSQEHRSGEVLVADPPPTVPTTTTTEPTTTTSTEPPTEPTITTPTLPDPPGPPGDPPPPDDPPDDPPPDDPPSDPPPPEDPPPEEPEP
jgi:hypothetical protein